MTEASIVSPEVTTGPLTAESLLPEARAISPMMERIEDSSAGESNPLPCARDRYTQRERTEGCSPMSVSASGNVPNNCSVTRTGTDDGNWSPEKGKYDHSAHLLDARQPALI